MVGSPKRRRSGGDDRATRAIHDELRRAEEIDVHGMEETQVEYQPNRARRRIWRIPADQPGASPDYPITVGELRINAPEGVTMNVYVRGGEPPSRGEAPEEIVNAGDVYVYDGWETVNITFPGGPVEGTVNVIIAPRA